MKILIIFCVVCCGIIGFIVKNRFVMQVKFLMWYKTFLENLLLNISIYKNNLTQIINNYLIMQNNKNAKFVNFFQKKDNLQAFNTKILDDYVLPEEWRMQISAFVNELGKADVLIECEKIKGNINFISQCIQDSEKDVKEKGDLYFKIWLAIGIILGVILW